MFFLGVVPWVDSLRAVHLQATIEKINYRVVKSRESSKIIESKVSESWWKSENIKKQRFQQYSKFPKHWKSVKKTFSVLLKNIEHGWICNNMHAHSFHFHVHHQCSACLDFPSLHKAVHFLLTFLFLRVAEGCSVVQS